MSSTPPTLSTPWEVEVNEGDTFIYTGKVFDEDGDLIALIDLDSVHLTVTEEVSGNVVNSRDNQNVKNTANCTYGLTDGQFEWSVQTADTDIVNSETPAGEFEIHNVTIVFGFLSGRQFTREGRIKVKNLRDIA